MNRMRISRRDILAGAGAVTLANGRVALAREDSAYTRWFKYNADLERSWSFGEAKDDPNIVNIRALGFESQQGAKVQILYPRASSAYDTAISKLLDVFDDKGLRLDIEVVNYMGDPGLAKLALKRAEKSGTSLMMAMGSESTAWLWQAYRGGAIPVVTVCSKDPVSLGQIRNYDSGSGSNFAFTSLNMPIEAQMAYVLQVKPLMKNIGVLVDSNNISAVETQAKPVADYANARGIRVLQLAVKDPKNVREEIERMVRQSVAAMQRTDPTLSNSVFWITGSTSVFDEIGAINREAGNVPVLSVVPEVVRAGDDSAAMSIGVSFESNAHLAAIYAADLLQKKARAGDLHVGLVSPPDIAINFRRAKAIGLRVPFNIFESASTIYSYDGRASRINGVSVINKT